MAIENASQANGIFRRMQELKDNRKAISESIANMKAALINYTAKTGPTLVYKQSTDGLDQPTMIETLKKVTTKLDLSSLAMKLNVSASDLDAPGIAKLTEEGKLSAEDFKGYEYQEERYVLHQRKARKAEKEAFRDKI